MFAPYLLYLKLGLFAILLIGLAFFGYKVNSWYQDSLRVSEVEAKAKLDVAQAQAVLAQQQKTFDEAQAASRSFQDELRKSADNRRRLDSIPVPVVRLCRPTPALPPSGPGASGPNEIPATPAEQSGQAGPDIGKPLYGLADDADQREAELSAQIRALQGLLSVESSSALK